MNSFIKNIKYGYSICRRGYYHNIMKNVPQPDRRRYYHDIMKNVPQPVVVVTTISRDNVKRGMTCASFNNVSYDPPIISFTLKTPSRIHSIIENTEKFTINILANHQVNIASHFALPAIDHCDQFKDYLHFINCKGNPEFTEAQSSITCTLHSSISVGDHNVVYGDVVHSKDNPEFVEPLLYYSRTYRSIGEEIFIAAFEDLSLPIDQWSHAAHVRMAWNYLKDYGKQEATPRIINGIKAYNSSNNSLGYHDTITNFYVNIIHRAIVQNGAKNNFNEFANCNKNLMSKDLLSEYYTKETLNSENAKIRFLAPDKKQI